MALRNSARLPAAHRLVERGLRRSADGALAGVPIAGLLGDQQAALLGQACFDAGRGEEHLWHRLLPADEHRATPLPSTCGLLDDARLQVRRRAAAVYALEGSIAITGALVQWLRDNLGLIASAAEIESLARQVADNGDVYIVPAFSGLYAPHWNERARGVIAGLTRFANKGHIARAALEATAYQTREVFEAMARTAASRSSNCASTAA